MERRFCYSDPMVGGDGEWMRSWVERMDGREPRMAEPEGVIANETPGSDELDSCKAEEQNLLINMEQDIADQNGRKQDINYAKIFVVCGIAKSDR